MDGTEDNFIYGIDDEYSSHPEFDFYHKGSNRMGIYQSY